MLDAGRSINQNLLLHKLRPLVLKPSCSRMKSSQNDTKCMLLGASSPASVVMRHVPEYSSSTSLQRVHMYSLIYSGIEFVKPSGVINQHTAHRSLFCAPVMHHKFASRHTFSWSNNHHVRSALEEKCIQELCTHTQL